MAEMTGRRWRVVRQTSSELPVLQLRDSSVDTLNSNSSSSGLETLNVREVVYALCIEIGTKTIQAP